MKNAINDDDNIELNGYVQENALKQLHAPLETLPIVPAPLTLLTVPNLLRLGNNGR